MEIAVVGAGYVGLTTATCFAYLGHRVVCVDIDADKIAALRAGRVPMLEDRLPELLADGLDSGRVRFDSDVAEAARTAEFVFLCVPTPQGSDGAADLSIVESVARQLAPVLADGAVLVTKSTVPVGSTRRAERILIESGLRAEGVRVAANPEFLREGSAVNDFLEPSRIVIGCDDRDAAIRVSELYRGVPAPMLITDPESAELIKYAANAFLATKVSFVNAIANVCEVVGADVREVRLGIGYDPRIGFDYLAPGPGYGGACLPKDVSALIHTADAAGYDFALLRGVEAVNDEQHERVLTKLRHAVGAPTLAGVRIAVWGLTFKAGTDDLRDSSAIAIVHRLLDEGADVRAFDPTVGESRPDELQRITVVVDAYDACAGAAALLVLTEWEQFRLLDFARVARTMAERTIVDARNVLNVEALRDHDFCYVGIGC